MKNNKFYTVVTLAVAGSLLLAGCTSGNGQTAAQENGEDTVLQYQGSPSAVIWPELAEDLGYLGDLELDYIGDSVGGPESIQLTATKQIDFGSAFNGAIIKSYSQGVNIQSVVGSYGSDQNTYVGAYALEGSGIESGKDFIGKKVAMNTLGAHGEFVLIDYLRQEGLTDKEIEEVTLVTIPMSNAEQALRNEQIDVVLFSGLARDLALEKGGINEVFKDTDVFGGEFTAGDYFFTQDYIEANPTTVKQFTEGVAKAIEWTKTTPREEVIERFETIINERDRKETTDNLKYWQSSGIAKEGGVITPSEYDVWINWLVEDGQLKEGEVKPEDLYTNEFNPFDEE